MQKKVWSCILWMAVDRDKRAVRLRLRLLLLITRPSDGLGVKHGNREAFVVLQDWLVHVRLVGAPHVCDRRLTTLWFSGGGDNWRSAVCKKTHKRGPRGIKKDVNAGAVQLVVQLILF